MEYAFLSQEYSVDSTTVMCVLQESFGCDTFIVSHELVSLPATEETFSRLSKTKTNKYGLISIMIRKVYCSKLSDSYKYNPLSELI